MNATFNAFVIEKSSHASGIRQFSEEDLPNEDVLIEVAYSTLNYKDGLAITGAAPVVHHWPMVGGIDLAGTVLSSRSPAWQAGDRVVVNGWGLSATHWSGYSGRQRVRADWLVRVPDAFTFQQAMAIGTAGYTAMLCVMALEEAGVSSGRGDVLVTGAAGGVGSISVALLSKLGYTVAASTGRPETYDYLKDLGASNILERATLLSQSGPLQSERWAGVIDCVGSSTLTAALAQTCNRGAVAACGFAGGIDLSVTMLPFIIRGVTLIGIDSVTAPMSLRQTAWHRLARDLDLEKLNAITSVAPMSDLATLAPRVLAGDIRGRVVIDVNK